MPMRGFVTVLRTGLTARSLSGLLAAVVVSTAASMPARAQQPEGGAPRAERAVGIAIVKTPQAYVGADEEWIPVPIFQFRKGGFFIEGIRLGYGWELPANWIVQISVMPQFAELDPESSPFLEGMEKRRFSVDGALTLAWEASRVTASLAAYSDLLGRSDGQRLEGEVGFPLSLGRWRIEPAVKGVWVDADFADYYVGIRPAEALPERPAFQGSSTFSPGLALGVLRPLREKLVLIGQAEVLFLGSGIRDSAVVGDDTMSVGLVGVAWSF